MDDSGTRSGIASRRLLVRGAAAGLGLALIGLGVVLAYSTSAAAGPFLLFDHPLLRHAGFLLQWGMLPFWLFVPLLAGAGLLFLSLVVSRSSRVLLWSAFMLFVVWALQVTGQLGIFRAPIQTVGEPLPSVWVRQASFTASIWGLGLFFAALGLVALADRLWKPGEAAESLLG